MSRKQPLGIRTISTISAAAMMLFLFMSPPALADIRTTQTIERGDTLDGIAREHSQPDATREEIRRNADLLAALNGIEVTYDEDGNRHANIVAGNVLDVGLFIEPSYTVRKGDTLASILRDTSPFTRSEEFSSLVDTVVAANDLESRDLIRSGQTLDLQEVNAQRFVRVPAHYVTVERGETLGDIARTLASASGQPEIASGLVYMLANLNGIEDINVIRAGSMLLTPVIFEWSHVDPEWLEDMREHYAAVAAAKAKADAEAAEAKTGETAPAETPPEEEAQNPLTTFVVVKREEETPVTPKEDSGDGSGDDDGKKTGDHEKPEETASEEPVTKQVETIVLSASTEAKELKETADGAAEEAAARQSDAEATRVAADSMQNVSVGNVSKVLEDRAARAEAEAAEAQAEAEAQAQAAAEAEAAAYATAHDAIGAASETLTSAATDSAEASVLAEESGAAAHEAAETGMSAAENANVDGAKTAKTDAHDAFAQAEAARDQTYAALTEAQSLHGLIKKLHGEAKAYAPDEAAREALNETLKEADAALAQIEADAEKAEAAVAQASDAPNKADAAVETAKQNAEAKRKAAEEEARRKAEEEAARKAAEEEAARRAAEAEAAPSPEPDSEYEDPLDAPEEGYDIVDPNEGLHEEPASNAEYSSPAEFAALVSAIDISAEEILSFRFNTKHKDVFSKSHGNRTADMKGVAFHYTDGDYDSDIGAYFRAIGGNSACRNGCSAHLFIPENASTVYQTVPEWKTKALHIGAEGNRYMGIEIEAADQEDISIAQVRLAIIATVRMLHESGVGITSGGGNVIGHAESDPSRKSDWEAEWMQPVRESVLAHYQKLQQATSANDWSEPSTAKVLEAMSWEYQAAMSEKPTLNEARERYNSRHGDTWGPTIPLEDVARVAYLAGFRGDNLVTAVAVAVAESNEPANRRNGNLGPSPFVIGDADINGTGDLSVGIWQIYTNVHKNDSGLRNPEANLDPMQNAKAAYSLSRTSIGWKHWSAYKSGNHKHFLDEARTAAENAGLIRK